MYSFQPVVAMPLDRAAHNVLIHLVNVPVMLDIKALNVIRLVVVIQLAQVAQHVMLLLVNALVTPAIQVPHVILVLPTTTEQVTELVQVSFNNIFDCIHFHLLVETKHSIISNVFIFSMWL